MDPIFSCISFIVVIPRFFYFLQYIVVLVYIKQYFSFYVNRSSAHFIEKNVPETTSLRDTFLSSYILLISLDCRLNQMRRTLNPVSVRHLCQRPCHLHRDKAACHLRIAADRHIVVEQNV